MVSYDGPNDTEAAQMETTKALIDYDHQKIRLIRKPEQVLQPDGSYERASGNPKTLPMQRLFFGGVTRDDQRSVNWQGENIISNWVLVGMPDADIKKNDTFSLWDRNWLVVAVHEDTRWQRKAWVVSRG